MEDNIQMQLGIVSIKALSTYRTQLMGIAALMIIACHAPASGVQMPHILSRIFTLGNYGVDIFLLLSGLGVYYSLSKKPVTSLMGGVLYYKRRFSRILIPYLMVYIPYCIVMMLLGKYSISDSLLCVTTLEFWISHRGAWFVSLILVLYLFSPALYWLMKSKGKWLWVIMIIAGIFAICNWPSVDDAGIGFTSNLGFALGRVPCFVLGMSVGNACQQDKKISVAWLVLPVILFVVCIKVFSIYDGLAWMLIPLVTYLLVFFLKLIENITWFVSPFNFLGKISLESYLTNITINSLLLNIIPAFISSPAFHGRWAEYSVVIMFGLICAYFVNRMSQRILQAI